ncbi:MAG: aminodeoxychorismate synthase component I [Bryobacterales bacterium]|nr:aminodeoxychorismate synthase component I [Bryobacterales bacterium]
MRVLIVDNKDSFTFNLVQLVERLTGAPPIVLDNSDCRWQRMLQDGRIGAVIISPGPGTPLRRSDFGMCPQLIAEADVPVLGICLGHQGIGCAYGASLVAAPVPMHGRVSRVTHQGGSLFDGIPESFDAVRYHSWCLDGESMPGCLRVSATTADGVPMAISHVNLPRFGVQFHPESIAAEFGERIVLNFLRLSGLANDSPGTPVRGERRASGRGVQCRPIAEVRRLETWVDPLDAFERLYASKRYAFWLDSAMRSPGLARFSVMGDASGPGSSVLLYRTCDRSVQTRRSGIWRTHRTNSLVDELRRRLRPRQGARLGLPLPFQTGLVGFIGYELRSEFGAPACREFEGPDAAFFDVDRCLVFDHDARDVFLVARPDPGGLDAGGWFAEVSRALDGSQPAALPRQRGQPPVVAELADGPETYESKIRQCLSQLAKGESYQICLTSEFSARCRVSPWAAYRDLRRLNPAPFAAYLRLGGFSVLSSSPERFLRVSPDRVITARPIKGTCARGSDPVADARLAHWLRTDEKFRSENLTIVDLLRNDIGRVASAGSVRVPRLMDVESFVTLHQLVSTVEGRLPTDRDCLDCLAAAFPGGSMTGAPKLRTMSIIDRLEGRPRGPYSGAIGYISHGDTMDLSIAIRTLVIRDSLVTIGSGGGIVAMSSPREEFEEMLLKARAPLTALAVACAGEPAAVRIRYATP